MTVIVLLVYVFILLVIAFGKTEGAFVALLLGTILFPPCALLMDNPAVSGQAIFLYLFLSKEYVKNTIEFKKAIKDFPLRYYLLAIAISYVVTTIFNFSVMNAYYGIRDMLDVYGYLVAALLAVRKVSWESVLRMIYWFVFIMCIYGLYEAATNSNILYKVINSAFPAYDGWYNLNGPISASEGWRMRTIITTKHPTALGTLLTVLFALYWNAYQAKSLSFWKKISILGLLGVNVILSGSRAAMFSVIVIILYSIIKTRGFLVKFFIIGVIAFSASYMVKYTIDNLMENNDGSSIVLRLNQLAFSIDRIKDSPIWGNGSNYTAHQIKDEGIRFDDEDEFIGGLESIAFVYMIDRGLLGVITFYLFWLMAFLYLRKKDKAYEGKKMALEVMPMGIVLFLSISGLIGNNTAYCFLILGLYMDFAEKKEENPKLA